MYRRSSANSYRILRSLSIADPYEIRKGVEDVHLDDSVQEYVPSQEVSEDVCNRIASAG